MKKIICLICARAGSKGLKNKNIKKFNGKPLIEWTFKVANSINEFDEIILSTDSKEIIKIAKRNKIEVPFIRPKNLAEDNSKEINVWKHTLKYLKKKKTISRYISCVACHVSLEEKATYYRGY